MYDLQVGAHPAFGEFVMTVLFRLRLKDVALTGFPVEACLRTEIIAVADNPLVRRVLAASNLS